MIYTRFRKDTGLIEGIDVMSGVDVTLNTTEEIGYVAGEYRQKDFYVVPDQAWAGMGPPPPPQILERPKNPPPVWNGDVLKFPDVPPESTFFITNEAGQTYTKTVGEEPEVQLLDPGRYSVFLHPPFPYQSHIVDVEVE